LPRYDSSSDAQRIENADGERCAAILQINAIETSFADNSIGVLNHPCKSVPPRADGRDRRPRPLVCRQPRLLLVAWNEEMFFVREFISEFGRDAKIGG
jgi:hypothetical protein